MDTPNYGFTLWYTGLSGAGKSTLSREVHRQLAQRGVMNVEILDGDEVRTHLTSELGFSREDRDRNIRRIGWVCKLLTRHGVPNMAAAISPYRATRQEVRQMIGRFVEVFVDCPLEVCEARDVKGLYAKARAGQIKGFTGIDDPYEPPESPEIRVRTAEEDVTASAERIIEYLIAHDYIPAVPSAEEKRRQVSLIEDKMLEMGYLTE